MKYRDQLFMNNQDLCRNWEVTPDTYIPVMHPEPYIPMDFIGFGSARNYTNEEKNSRGVHFFLDDYKIDRVWRHAEFNFRILVCFKGVLTPDFSLYTDWDIPVQKWNHYRKQFIGAYWQSLGLLVYPTICWSDSASFDWCFDGVPEGGCVAVSSVGTQMNPVTRGRFMDGYREMMRRLRPETVLFYGKVPDGCEGNIAPIEAFQTRFDKLRRAGDTDHTDETPEDI